MTLKLENINCMIIKIKCKYYKKYYKENKKSKYKLKNEIKNIIDEYNVFQEVLKNTEMEKTLDIIDNSKNIYEIIYLPLGNIDINNETFIINMVCLKKKYGNQLLKIKMKITHVDEIKYSSDEGEFYIY
jgi:hypothetical protein